MLVLENHIWYFKFQEGLIETFYDFIKIFIELYWTYYQFFDKWERDVINQKWISVKTKRYSTCKVNFQHEFCTSSVMYHFCLLWNLQRLVCYNLWQKRVGNSLEHWTAGHWPLTRVHDLHLLLHKSSNTKQWFHSQEQDNWLINPNGYLKYQMFTFISSKTQLISWTTKGYLKQSNVL